MKKPTTISCIGAGNVATRLVVALHDKGIPVRQIISKHGQSAANLARLVNAPLHGNELSELDDKSDFYLVAVKDDDIRVVLQDLPFCLTGDQVLIHTSGSFNENEMSGCARHFGCFYPLQTFRKDIKTDLMHTPFLINGNDEETLQKIHNLASLISDHVNVYSFADRQNIHVAAVIVNNFTNHLFTMAKSYCEIKQVEFTDLWPLIEEGIRNARMLGPENVQTGPAVRGDNTTIANHLRKLEDQPELANIYKLLTVSIQNWHHHENPEGI